MIQEMHSVLEYAKQCMQGALERPKFYADQRRSVREFEVGQKLFLKVTPKRSGLKLGRSRKLFPRFCGPFQICKRIVQVAYALNLTKDWKIYYVFHVSLLRIYVYVPNHMLPNLPPVVHRGKCWLNLKEICRLICKTLGLGQSQDFLLSDKIIMKMRHHGN